MVLAILHQIFTQNLGLGFEVGQAFYAFHLTCHDFIPTVNSPGWATEETFQQPTRPADDFKVLTKYLQDIT